MSSSKQGRSSHKPKTSSKSHTFEDGLPRSVCDAPDELRAVIRRRQNTENARRMRERQREQMEFMETKYEENQRRIVKLEKTVDELSAELLSGTKINEASSSGRSGGNKKYDRYSGAPF